jgi:hypothetical protein
VQVPQEAAQLSNVRQHLVDRAHIRTRHNFKQWHAGTIEVHKGETVVHIVQIFARILSDKCSTQQCMQQNQNTTMRKWKKWKGLRDKINNARALTISS